MTNFCKTIKQVGLVFAGCFLLSFGAQAMAGIFGSNTLFSQVDGVVTLGGKPCAAAKIQQKVFKANSEEITANAVTDKNGVTAERLKKLIQQIMRFVGITVSTSVSFTPDIA